MGHVTDSAVERLKAVNVDGPGRRQQAHRRRSGCQVRRRLHGRSGGPPNEPGPARSAAPPSPVTDADQVWWRRRIGQAPANQAQDDVVANQHRQSSRKTGTGLTAEHHADIGLYLGQTIATARLCAAGPGTRSTKTRMGSGCSGSGASSAQSIKFSLCTISEYRLCSKSAASTGAHSNNSLRNEILELDKPYHLHDIFIISFRNMQIRNFPVM